MEEERRLDDDELGWDLYWCWVDDTSTTPGQLAASVSRVRSREKAGE